MKQLINKVTIDDKRTKVLTIFVTKNGSKEIKSSDHNVMIGEFFIPVQKVHKKIIEILM